jgi:hypothetical protein
MAADPVLSRELKSLQEQLSSVRRERSADVGKQPVAAAAVAIMFPLQDHPMVGHPR